MKRPLTLLLQRCWPWLLCLALLLGVVFTPRPALALAEQEAVFAGGCFWCLEHDLETLPGVVDVESGYSGGHLDHPRYEQVSAGGTGHQEAVKVRFDPARMPYTTLLRAYWRNVDPLDGSGQFCDRGSSYRPVIFPQGQEQQRQAQESLEAAALALQRPLQALQVAIQPLDRFWPAEDHHQNYAERNPVSYAYYRWACGRDRRLDQVWGPQARSSAPW
ncbi:peptide-methionine (S)-S-oxide reductase MsrA [Cyanobium sp. NIES-981]|uniref:peptide-methionine (S)-S-oxide reductase MsrA n=1 Tax=Cyanobium sp. NIES-981 TaxID=1851505 RepID=UPI0007DE190D|nr:peptide-methionine (S)-S-oxide reductase MsrA [Cyanobium sp. NIES-981]SBO44474.1 Peptide methionine sulfoxide reductase MsrA 2 [Cyanobium sp. NIES-981]